jgi:hypothetical protein
MLVLHSIFIVLWTIIHLFNIEHSEEVAMGCGLLGRTWVQLATFRIVVLFVAFDDSFFDISDNPWRNTPLIMLLSTLGRRLTTDFRSD